MKTKTEYKSYLKSIIKNILIIILIFSIGIFAGYKSHSRKDVKPNIEYVIKKHIYTNDSLNYITRINLLEKQLNEKKTTDTLIITRYINYKEKVKVSLNDTIHRLIAITDSIITSKDTIINTQLKMLDVKDSFINKQSNQIIYLDSNYNQIVTSNELLQTELIDNTKKYSKRLKRTRKLAWIGLGTGIGLGIGTMLLIK